MMIKKLTRQGNSSALIIDRTMMDLMGIDQDTDLKLTLEGRKLLVEPVTVKDRDAKFQAAVKRTFEKNAELYRRLAQ